MVPMKSSEILHSADWVRHCLPKDGIICSIFTLAEWYCARLAVSEADEFYVLFMWFVNNQFQTDCESARCESRHA